MDHGDSGKDNPEVYKSFDALAPAPAQKGSQKQEEEKPQPAQSDPMILSPEYLAGGYLDAEGHLRKEIFIDWPEKEVVPKLLNADVPAAKSSLRAFYSMLRMAKTRFDRQQRAKNRGEALGDAKTQLYKMRVGAVYQKERGVVSSVCQEFLFRNIDTVLEHVADFEEFAKNLNAFVEHFQAVIAYLPERPQH